MHAGDGHGLGRGRGSSPVLKWLEGSVRIESGARVKGKQVSIMIRRSISGFLATVGLVLAPWATSMAQYSGRSGSGYGAASGFGYSFRSPDTASSLSTTRGTGAAPLAPTTTSYRSMRPTYTPGGSTFVFAPSSVNIPPTYNGNSTATSGYGVWTNAPSALAYSAYGLPGNYYQPAQSSYLPYSPYIGATPAGYGMPVRAITFQTPNGPLTLGQAATNVTGNEMLYRAGYAGYTAPTPYYSYGMNSTFGTSPTYPTYGASTPSLVTPYGTYGNIISPPGTATGISTGAPSMGSGTFGFGVNPGSP